jgi:membrane-associated phospholipid phosphatase
MADGGGTAILSAPGHLSTMAIIPGRWIVLGLGLSIVVVGLMMRQAGLTIDLATISGALACGGAVAAIGLRYGFGDPQTECQRTARDAGEYVGLFALICLLGAVASYPAAADSAGFVDPVLVRIDHALHFNWIGWYDIVSAHPSLQLLGAAAYASIYVTPAILLGYFAHADRRGDARLFLTSFWLAAIATLALFTRFPAEGPLAFLWQGRIPYMPASALYQAQLIPELRNHTLHEISFGTLHGLVCTPSFHTTSAVLYIFTAWRVPRLRWPLIALNIAMLLSTPVEGTHYLADMIAGALVAIATILVTSMAMRIHGGATTAP